MARRPTYVGNVAARIAHRRAVRASSHSLVLVGGLTGLVALVVLAWPIGLVVGLAGLALAAAVFTLQRCVDARNARAELPLGIAGPPPGGLQSPVSGAVAAASVTVFFAGLLAYMAAWTRPEVVTTLAWVLVPVWGIVLSAALPAIWFRQPARERELLDAHLHAHPEQRAELDRVRRLWDSAALPFE